MYEHSGMIREADRTYSMPRMFLEIRFKPSVETYNSITSMGVGIFKIDSF